MPGFYIGLMSGTSMDGIDAALVDIQPQGIQLVETHQQPIPPSLKQQLQKLIVEADHISLDTLGSCDSALGDIFAEAAIQLINKTHIQPRQIKAIGCHGQTIRHQPDTSHPFSMQIGDANRIAYKTRITTIADFRRKDMAAGGQGAPLTPAFHQAVFSSPTEDRAILNIGGIANLSYLPKDRHQPVSGFDCGPGNTLMDIWIQKTRGKSYDRDGCWAASASPHPPLLERLMEDSFIHRTPPKSTGREHYNLQWLQQQLKPFRHIEAPQIQATLSAFTAECIRYAVHHHLPHIDSLIVCGGGAHNKHLMQQIGKRLEHIQPQSSDHLGIAADWVEAVAFAWLARQTLEHQPGNLPEVTGASESTILGAIYSAD